MSPILAVSCMILSVFQAVIPTTAAMDAHKMDGISVAGHAIKTVGRPVCKFAGAIVVAKTSFSVIPSAAPGSASIGMTSQVAAAASHILTRSTTDSTRAPASTATCEITTNTTATATGQNAHQLQRQAGGAEVNDSSRIGKKRVADLLSKHRHSKLQTKRNASGDATAAPPSSPSSAPISSWASAGSSETTSITASTTFADSSSRPSTTADPASTAGASSSSTAVGVTSTMKASSPEDLLTHSTSEFTALGDVIMSTITAKLATSSTTSSGSTAICDRIKATTMTSTNYDFPTACGMSAACDRSTSTITTTGSTTDSTKTSGQGFTALCEVDLTTAAASTVKCGRMTSTITHTCSTTASATDSTTSTTSTTSTPAVLATKAPQTSSRATATRGRITITITITTVVSPTSSAVLGSLWTSHSIAPGSVWIPDSTTSDKVAVLIAFSDLSSAPTTNVNCFRIKSSPALSCPLQELEVCRGATRVGFQAAASASQLTASSSVDMTGVTISTTACRASAVNQGSSNSSLAAAKFFLWSSFAIFLSMNCWKSVSKCKEPNRERFFVGQTNFASFSIVTAATLLIALTLCGTARATPITRSELEALIAAGHVEAIQDADTSAITDMSQLFAWSDFNGDLSKWNVAAVTDMSHLFARTSNFNGDLSKWNVAAVTSMSFLFSFSNFNGDISKWNVAAGTILEGMFGDNRVFNSDLSKWDVSSATTMQRMFQRATSFNSDLSKWDVSSVTHMLYMFQDTNFNGDISKWDVSSVTNFGAMLEGSPFNGDLCAWNFDPDQANVVRFVDLTPLADVPLGCRTECSDNEQNHGEVATDCGGDFHCRNGCVDGCALNGGCDKHAACTESSGTFSCTCNIGYVGNGSRGHCVMGDLDCQTEFQCQRDSTCSARGSCTGTFLEDWTGTATCRVSTCTVSETCELRQLLGYDIVCCSETGGSNTSHCAPTACEEADSALCYTKPVQQIAYPSSIFHSDTRSHFFPQEFECATQSTSQAVAGHFSRTRVTTCSDCASIAAQQSSRSGICFEPDVVASSEPYAWWPSLDVLTQHDEDPAKDFSMILDLHNIVLIDAVAIVFGAAAGEALEIDSITACFARENVFASKWMAHYADVERWRLTSAAGITAHFDDLADQCVRIVDEAVQLGAETVDYESARVKLANHTLARYVVLQVSTRGIANPIIDRFDVLPHEEGVKYCSTSTGFAVCFCPPGYFGSGFSQAGCNNTAWVVTVPVSLSWAGIDDINSRFGARNSQWGVDEIHFWQVLLGKNTTDPFGSDVPHYWMSSMKVSVLEVQPGNFTATLYPLFYDNATAQEARGRLTRYLASNDNTIMRGKALVNKIDVRAWDGDDRECPRPPWGARPSLECESSSFSLCTDGNPSCICEGGGIAEYVWCADVPECTSSHETCHINEICYLACDVNECAESEHECDHNALCRNTLESYECECAPGWEGAGTIGNCSDVDECEGRTHNCHSLAMCQNNEGGFECYCPPGFLPVRGENRLLECRPLDECANPDRNDCDDNANCTDTDSSFECACNSGFQSTGDFAGVVCGDVDECDVESHECDPNADCTNVVGSFLCACRPGWSESGEACMDVNECEEVPNACHPLAECNNTQGSFECVCRDGYDGTGVECDDVDECSAQTHACDASAECNNTIGGYTCECGAGWTQQSEEEEQDARLVCTDINECAQAPPCDLDATCSNTNGSYSCSCNPGFSGDGTKCLQEDLCLRLSCDENADCREHDGEWVCECLHPFTGDGSWCQEDECASASHNCHFAAECLDVFGSFQCSCGVGWFGDSGVDCQDVDECGPDSIASRICAPEARCTNTNGSFTCACEAGYRDVSEGLGFQCLNVDECELGWDNCDSALAGCQDTNGSFACTCARGYTDDSGLGVACRDMDECKEGRGSVGDCGSYASCVNSEGSFECACFAGFQRSNGSRGTCENIDECADHALNNCDQHASCNDAVGTFTCACNRGYQGTGSSCEDVNECSEPDAEHLCEEHAECANTEGSFTCECKSGFLQEDTDGITACQDLDECLVGLDDCDVGAACANTNGSFACECLQGWVGNGTTCADVDECSGYEDDNLCPGEPSCVNTDGSFVCDCPTGKRADANLSCVDIDECLVEDDNCHVAGGICNNTEGSFECRCREGWTGNGVDCEDIDECAQELHNCLDPPKATCYNNDGSFTCDCELGLAGEDCDQIPCDAGEFLAKATKDCASCRPGTFSANGTKCEVCPAGTYSWPGASSCQDCQPGRFSLPGSGFCAFVQVESSCEECSFLAFESAGDRQLVRFGSCEACEHLEISNQRISWIQDAFAGMRQLQSLDLSWNLLRKLRRNMFQDLDSLRSIDLRGNQLFGLDRFGGKRQGIFYLLSNLEEIQLQGQRRLTAHDPTILETLDSLAQTGSLRHIKKLDLSVDPNDRGGRRAAPPVKSRAPQARRTDGGSDDEPMALVELSLAGNDLGSLGSGDLAFPDLQVLNISDCGIAQLSDGAFDGMPNLVELHLQNNAGRRNKILRPGMFVGMTQLEVLDLRSDRVAGIQAGTFAGLARLKRLLLSGNLLCTPRPGSRNQDLCDLIGEELSSEAFRGLSALEELDLSENTLLGVLRTGVLQGLERLQSLSVRQNLVHTGLVQIDAGALSELRNLTALDLSGNSLGDIDELLFSSLGNLTHLNLRYNRLERITEGVLAPLSRLQSLKLDHNSLLSIDNGALDNLQQLTKLDLGFNYLMDSPFAFTPLLDDVGLNLVDAANKLPTFNKLAGLKELDLSHNELKFVRREWFAGLDKLQKLSLAFNRIVHLPSGVFRNQPFLRELDLQGNHYSVGYFLPADAQVAHVYFRHLPRPDAAILREVYRDYQEYMEGFQWRTSQRFLVDWGSMVLARDAFEGLSSLRTLRLSHNGIRAIPPGVFDALDSLESLHLDWNAIQGFRDSDFASLHNLTELRLRQRGAPCYDDDEECWNALSCLPGATFARDVIKDVGWPLPDCPEGPMPLLRCPGCEFALTAGTTLSRSGACELCLNIDLSYSGIVTVASGAFDDVSSARQMQLQGNMLLDMEGAPFSRLAGLRTLDLSDNQLTALSSDVFNGLRQLRLLDLSRNALVDIQAGAFEELAALERLFLSGHRLQHIDMQGSGLPPSLRFLDLSEYEVARVFSDILSLPTANFRTKSFALQPEEPEIIWDPDTTNIESLKMQGMGLSRLDKLRGLSSLRELDFGGNVLDALTDDGALSDLEALQSLLLNNNKLKTIERGAFRGLANVVELSLHSNMLEALPEGAFNGLDNLVKLDLSENRFERFIWETTWAVNAWHVDVTDQFQLRSNDEGELEFARTEMKCIPLFPRLLHCRSASCLTAAAVLTAPDVMEDSYSSVAPAFLNVPSYFSDLVTPAEDETGLELCGFVSMSDAFGTCGCTFVTTEEGALLRHGNCSVLCQAFDFSDSGITSIDASAFEGLETLRMLVLAGNDIAHIEDSAFSDNVRLQMLDLSYNKVQSIEPGAFRSLRVLSHLILARNDLDSISNPLLAPLTALEYLDLQQNRIAVLMPLSLPSELRALKLSHNSISFDVLGGSLFTTGTSLEELDLDHNPLGRLPAHVFAGADRLVSLTLSYSGVTQVEADAFAGLSGVVRLRMDGNTIPQLVDHTFRGLSGLRVLELQSAGVEVVSLQALRDVPDLQVLNLRDNAIQIVRRDVFQALHDPLLEVDLSQNLISVVEPNTFNVTRRFRLLNLTHNDITLLAPGTMPFVDEAYVFEGNRIVCVPVFHANTLVIDWRYSRLPPWASFCLPSACQHPLAEKLTLSKLLPPWSLTERSVILSVERMMTQLLRTDIATVLDDLNLHAGMYIDTGAGQRTWCTPAHATFEPSISPCNTPGFYGNPCRPCPEDHYCPGLNRSFACPDGRSSPAGSTHQAACFQCSAGEFLFLDNLGCEPCPAGRWCTDQTLRACPSGALCAGGAAMPVCPTNTWLDLETGSCVSFGRVSCEQLAGDDDSEALAQYGGCSGNCTCSEAESSTCHMLAFCTGFSFAVAVPAADGIVEAGVSHPDSSDGLYACTCPKELLGHGYGADGCESKGWAVRIVYKDTSCLSESEEKALLALLGGLTCRLGATEGCDHIHYTHHGGKDLGVNVLFRHTEQGKAAAESAAATFNNASSSRRRTGEVPGAVDPRVGARVYAWNAAGTAAPVAVLPAGMQVRAVHFEAGCAHSGCWVLDVMYTTGSSDVLTESYNSFYLPYAVGSDALSYDYDYSDQAILDTFQPATFPCRTSDYVASSGRADSLPGRATGCCFGTEFNPSNDELGGDGSGGGVLGRYRVTTTFASYAARVHPQLCPGGYDDPQIVTSGSTLTPKPEEVFPSASEARGFVAEGVRFAGMNRSRGITRVAAVDPFVGQYQATIKLDETELRTKAGLLRGTVGVEHTVDFFLGFVTFKPAATTWILDSLATQVAVHVEKTSFFTASTHGVNDYTFLEYVNLRLVAVLQENLSEPTSIPNLADSAAQYVQVTFTLGAKYDINANSGLIPLDSVRAGTGTFFSDTESAGDLHQKCIEYTSAPANEFSGSDDIVRFNRTLEQACAPAAAMCVSPASVPDRFVSFNVPLGFGVFGESSDSLTKSVFVDLVISAVDTEARAAQTDPGAGQAPWQVKTTLSATVPIVNGGVNTFCDSAMARTELKDVANVDIVVGTAASLEEVSRLRIIEDVASDKLDAPAQGTIDSDSIEAGLLTLVLKGNESYFASGNADSRGVSLELEDVITVHLMEGDGSTSDGSGSQGKQKFVKDLLAEAPGDSSDSSEPDGDSYSLNGALFFTIDRAAQRAHLEPTSRLLAVCPLNPARPVETGNMVLETCVLRRDVRFRDFPWRADSMSTAMEVSHSAGETLLDIASTEARFFTTMFGNSDYAKQLAVGFAGALDAKYNLDGRFRRAFWINPGYEWTPTQTGGGSLFQLSQKVFLFALVSLDERLASAPGKSTFDSPQFSGAAAGLPKVPSVRRRMLLTVDPRAGESSMLSAAEMEFPVTRTSATALAFGVPLTHVATFAVLVQLTVDQACDQSLGQLQSELQSLLASHVAQSASAVETVQVVSVARSSETRCESRRSSSAGLGDVEMMVVFAPSSAPNFDLAGFSALPGIEHIVPLVVSQEVVDLIGVAPPVGLWSSVETPEAPNTGNTFLIIGVASGATALMLAAIAAWYVRGVVRRSKTAGLAELHSFDSREFDDGFDGGLGPENLLLNPGASSVCSPTSGLASELAFAGHRARADVVL